mmetsp:Transcript_30165/g.89729  ORF Transcript_30165/g.89729 Transcript_30165/m.89729 type:complete len:1079 (-) Transcript_30165:43-3279(-)
MTDRAAPRLEPAATVTMMARRDGGDDDLPHRRQTTRRRAVAAAALTALGTVVLLNALSFNDATSGGRVRGAADAGRGWARRRWSERFLSRSTRRRLCAASSAARISRRLEEELCESTSSPYVSQQDMIAMADRGAEDPRSVPSHVALCRELVQRDDIKLAKGTINESLGLHEDPALCKDWTSPHFALMEIMASTLVANAADSLQVSYRHNCGSTQDSAPNAGTSFDRTTVQQMFPPSSLILDDRPVPFDAIKRLCKGCISEFESGSWDAHVDVHAKLSHHCMMYPGHKINEIEAMTFDESATEDEIDAEREKLAGEIPLAAVFPTMKDRMRILASETQMRIGNPFGQQEGVSGVVIPFDMHSGMIPAKHYATAIGDDTVTSIQILSTGSCATAKPKANGDQCLSHGQTLKGELEAHFPNAIVRHDIVSSTNAAYSRMILAKLLVCPPETIQCLIPAMAKEEGTIAKIFEGSAWPGTWKFFNFIRQWHNNIITIDLDAANQEGGTVLGAGGVEGAAGSHITGYDSSAFAGVSDAGDRFTDAECVDMQGRSGSWASWEMDFTYDDLQAQSRTNLHGNTARGVNHERNGREQQGVRRALQSVTTSATWNDDNCPVEPLNRDDVCDVLDKNGIDEIHMVGDYAARAQVDRLLASLGIAQNDVSVDHDGNFRKSFSCATSVKTIVFVNNPLLDVEGNQQFTVNTAAAAGMDSAGTQYVGPPQRSRPPVVNPPAVGGGGYGYQQPQAPMQYQQQQPVNYGYQQPQPPPMQYMAGAPMMQAMPAFMPMPMSVPYAGACTCSHWTEGYQQPLPPGGGGRKLLVAGMGASDQAEDLDAHKEHFENFRRLAETISSPRDIVVYRTTPPEHAFCPGEGDVTSAANKDEKKNPRRLAPAKGLSSPQNVREFNRHAKQSIHEMKRRHLTSPKKGGRARFHILDVERMTAAHPDATEGGMRDLKCDPDGGNGRGSDIHDHWNMMLFGMLKGIHAGEKMQGQKEAQAPQVPPQAPQDQVQGQARVPPQAQAAPPPAGYQLQPQTGVTQPSQESKPENQPAASESVQMAWDQVMRQVAVDKQSDPGHMVLPANP